MNPGIFEFLVTIHLTATAIKHSPLTFNAMISLPSVPLLLDDPGMRTAYEGISNVVLEMPSASRIFVVKGDIETAVPSQTALSIKSWVTSCLDILKSEESFTSGLFSLDSLIRLMRGIWYLYDVKNGGVDDHRLYRDMVNTLGAISLHRYCVTILKPLTSCIHKEIGMNRPRLVAITSALEEIAILWTEYSSSTIPGELKVWLIYFRFYISPNCCHRLETISLKAYFLVQTCLCIKTK